MAAHISISELQTVLLAVKQFIVSKIKQSEDSVLARVKNVEDSIASLPTQDEGSDPVE